MNEYHDWLVDKLFSFFNQNTINTCKLLLGCPTVAWAEAVCWAVEDTVRCRAFCVVSMLREDCES